MLDRQDDCVELKVIMCTKEVDERRTSRMAFVWAYLCILPRDRIGRTYSRN